MKTTMHKKVPAKLDPHKAPPKDKARAALAVLVGNKDNSSTTAWDKAPANPNKDPEPRPLAQDITLNIPAKDGTDNLEVSAVWGWA